MQFRIDSSGRRMSLCAHMGFLVFGLVLFGAAWWYRRPVNRWLTHGLVSLVGTEDQKRRAALLAATRVHAAIDATQERGLKDAFTHGRISEAEFDAALETDNERGK